MENVTVVFTKLQCVTTWKIYCSRSLTRREAEGNNNRSPSPRNGVSIKESETRPDQSLLIIPQRQQQVICCHILGILPVEDIPEWAVTRQGAGSSPELR